MSAMRREALASRVAGVILAGGQGTRLFPLTQYRSKPAVGFGGRYRLIDIPLSNALNSKITRLYVISQYFASSLHQHILATYHLDLFQSGGIELICPEENASKKIWFEGTADAVRKNLDNLLKAPVDYFLILSGDQLYNIDFQEMIQFAEEKNADVVIASLKVDEAEAKRMGVLKIDRKNKIVDFIEKPEDRATLDKFQIDQHYLGSMGIYVFRREALIALLKEKGDDFGHHLLPMQVKKESAFAYVYKGYWVDIGTIASFYEANMALLLQKPCLDMYDEFNPIFTRPQNLPSPIIRHATVDTSLISQGSIIEGEEITRSIIGIRTHVKKGTRIVDSIVMGNHFYHAPLHQSPPLPPEFTIGEDCVIEKAIIDEHCRIGNRVRLVNEKKLQKFDGDGVFIRDGIIIVTTGCDLPDGFSL
jgi:glucose-1-phosphate adenylyltransferase